MLMSFSVSNYRSFDMLERFSMEAGRARNFSTRISRQGNGRILKFKAIYGANASGKSNLVKAIDFMRRTVLHKIPAESSMDYCRRTDENVNKPSFFEAEIVINGIRFIYGFEVVLSSGKFVREWFYEKKAQKQRMIFERNISSGEYCVTSYTNSNTYNDRLRIYADDVKNDDTVLFLCLMNQNKDALYAEDSPLVAYQRVFNWFKSKLSVNHPNEPITHFTYFFDSEGSAKAEELLSRLDTGISKVQVCVEPIEKIIAQFPKELYQDILEGLNEQKRKNEEQGREELPAIMLRNSYENAMYILEMDGEELTCKTLKFKHKHSNSIFLMRDESDGTIRLLDLLEILFSKNDNRVYVIDEISRCLHPMLTKRFIKNFLDLASERNTQLIATTHEIELMDLELVRQDEIGFIGRRESNGTSKIFGLDEFSARFDKRIRRAYIDGDYGAIPRFE